MKQYKSKNTIVQNEQTIIYYSKAENSMVKHRDKTAELHGKTENGMIKQDSLADGNRKDHQNIYYLLSRLLVKQIIIYYLQLCRLLEEILLLLYRCWIFYLKGTKLPRHPIFGSKNMS